MLFEGDFVPVAFMRGFKQKPKPLACDEKCPDCGEELKLTEPGVIHLDPPRRRVKCLQCGYRGFISAHHPTPDRKDDKSSQ